ncbi:Protein LLP-like protein [Armadillidium vulgare]|nr:Protein LLP-like protein [Armadillidium vulgare]
MAKSIRSKWSRARRRDKRKKYGKKELVKLQGIVKNRESREQALQNINAVVNKIKNEPGSEPGNSQIDSNPELTSEYDPKTLKNKDGNFPPWLNRRALKKRGIKFKSGKKKIRVNYTLQ